MNNYAIAIDGPAGAGKSTISKIVAEKLELEYIDTGSMYRAITFKALENNLDFSSADKLVDLLHSTEIDFRNNHIYLDGKAVDKEIRSKEVTENVSLVAKIEEIREILVKKQRQIAENKSIVMDGRDIGTTVLKNAKYKFFLTASVEERARRRYNESEDSEATYESIKIGIIERDKTDMNRDISPLKKASDAVEIDTTDMSIEEVVEYIVKSVNGREL
jgi:CMP/dCMP kinase